MTRPEMQKARKEFEKELEFTIQHVFDSLTVHFSKFVRALCVFCCLEKKIMKDNSNSLVKRSDGEGHAALALLGGFVECSVGKEGLLWTHVARQLMVLSSTVEETLQEERKTIHLCV